MIKIKYIFFIILFFLGNSLFSQTIKEELMKLELEISHLNSQKDSLNSVAELLKLANLKSMLLSYGLPELLDGEDLVCHSAYCLVYSEEHEMAKWVAHIISHDIVKGSISRTNDFRIDTLIKTGSSEEADFFIKIKKDDGSIKYDGFGYDRGHLAPSADFRWSPIALSESYYYSNMTPQLPRFNRNKWAEVEAFVRNYIIEQPEKDLFVVTAPVLHAGLEKIKRSKNNISIPELHYKIVVDYESKKGIAFLINQNNIDYPIDSYVVTIDSIEKLTNINFYPNLSEEDELLIESQSDISLWRFGKSKNDQAPLTKSQFPKNCKNCYNTVEAKQFYDYPNEVSICGTVVSAHKSKKGHIFLNLDKAFPQQIFTATIWKTNESNFSYQPAVFLINKKVCIKGKVKDFQGVPSMYPENEKSITIIE